MSASDAARYKARKEAFVSNLSGSSLLDINLVTLVAPAAILLWTALQKRQSLFVPYNPLAFAVDFLLNVCAVLFAFTLYSSAPILLNIFLAIPAIFLLLPLLPSPKSTRRSGTQDVTKSATSAKQSNVTTAKLPNRPFVTNYRGTMMVATCMAILAVDFRVFPRRFAKVETWGTSMMDLGVGSFVFSAGVVSARQVLSLSASSSSRRPLYQRLVGSLRSSAPLLVLGLIRLYSVKGLDYAEHVTEYGVHWNFFFTLGMLPPCVELSDSIIQLTFRSYDVLAVLVAVVYEVTLNNTDLLRYILISPRGPSLLSKNREGVFSFIGYLAIFLSGRGIGTRILAFQLSDSNMLKTTDTRAAVSQDRRSVLRNLLATAAIYIVLFALCTNYWTFNLNVSRRLANASYIFWIAAYNNAQLFLFGVVEHFGPYFAYPQLMAKSSSSKSKSHKTDTSTTAMTEKPEHASSRVLQAFNRNGLAIFLVANLLTGLVNLTFNTLDASSSVAMGILITYAAVLTSVAVGLDVAGVRIKL